MPVAPDSARLRPVRTGTRSKDDATRRCQIVYQATKPATHRVPTVPTINVIIAISNIPSP